MSVRLASLALAAALIAPASAKPPIYYPSALGLPFSEAVQIGDTLYLSGQIGAPPGTKTPVPGGIEREARQVMDNVGDVLRRRGLGYENLIKCTVMLADMKDWPTFNTVYAGYFKSGRFPARSAFGTNGLAYGSRVELECIASVPAGK